MSLFKFGRLEAEVDFMDAEFLDRLYDAKKELSRDVDNVPKTGKMGDIVRAQCACYYNFFDALFGEGAGDEIFCGKHSMSMCLDAASALSEIEAEQVEKYNATVNKYMIQPHKNRAQRREEQRQQRAKNPNKFYKVQEKC